MSDAHQNLNLASTMSFTGMLQELNRLASLKLADEGDESNTYFENVLLGNFKRCA